VAEGLDKNDYRASRHRLGAVVRIGGKVSAKGRIHYVSLPSVPKAVGLCSPRKKWVYLSEAGELPRRVVVKVVKSEFSACMWDDVAKMKADLAKKLDEVDSFLGKVGMGYSRDCDNKLVPTAGLDGAADGGIGWEWDSETTASNL
jgi:hypothetical protein